MKTWVKLESDSQYKDYLKGDEGFIEGAVQGADDRPYIVVCLLVDRRVVLVPSYQLKVLGMIVQEGAYLRFKQLEK